MEKRIVLFAAFAVLSLATSSFGVAEAKELDVEGCVGILHKAYYLNNGAAEVSDKKSAALEALVKERVAEGAFKEAMSSASKIKNKTAMCRAVEGVSTEAYRLMMRHLRVDDFAAAEGTLKYVQYPMRREAAICYLAIKYTGAGDFGKAEDWIQRLTSDEKAQIALYNLAVEGYAARGKMGWALSTAKRIESIFLANTALRAVPKRPHILRDMAIMAVINNFGLDEAEARLNAIRVLEQIGDVYYRLRALETAVLYTDSAKKAEALLTDAGYHRIGKPVPEETVIGPLATIFYARNDGHVTVVVQYGVEEGAGLRPFKVDRLLDEESQKEFTAMLERDGELQKYLAEQQDIKEKQKKKEGAERDLIEGYQGFLENPSQQDPQPAPTNPPDDHKNHEGHGGMHH